MYINHSDKSAYMYYWVAVFFLLASTTNFFSGGDTINPQFGIRAIVELGLSFFLVIYLFVRKNDFQWPQFSSIIFILLFLFIGWALVSIFWSTNPLLSLGKAIELFLHVLAAWMISSGVEKYQLSLPRIIATVIAGIVFLLFFTNIVMQINPLNLSMARPRLTLGYMHPIELAHNLSVFVLLLYSWLLTKTSRNRRPVFIFILVVAYTFLLLTDARTSIAVTTTLIFLSVLLLADKQTKKYLLPAFFVLLAFVSAYTVFTNSSILDDLFEFANDQIDRLNSLNGRSQIWRSIFTILEKNNPWLGMGYESGRAELMSSINWRPSHAHNSYLQIYYTLGIPGLGIMSAITLWIIRELFIVSKPTPFFLVGVYSLLLSIISPVLFIPGTTMSVILLLIAGQVIHKNAK